MRFVASLCVVLALLLGGCREEPGTLSYITWDGLEPDKWASVWLIRKLEPDAEIVIRPVGAPLEGGIPFGVPDSDLRRTQGVSIYESLLKSFRVRDPVLIAVGEIIHDIEISPWAPDRHAHSVFIEQAFRKLQERFPERRVPMGCYGRFFDGVYKGLQANWKEGAWAALESIGKADDPCREEETELAKRDNRVFVGRVRIYDLLGMIASGKNVVFVDAREAGEFDEVHIPGAINLQLRDIDESVRSRFEGADLVIGYCIKDFRGFEVARALAEIGVRPTAIMEPFGLAGWRSLKLPVAGGSVSEEEGLKSLMACARRGGRC